MRHLSGLFLVLVITLLQACGGASNRDQLAAQTPTTPPTPATLFTTAPSSITFLSGAASGAYTISGGAAPYAASSSNAAVAAVSVSGAAFTIAPGLVGSATVLVIDSAGTKIEIATTVGSSGQVTALRTTAASAITLGNGGSGTFSIAGGVAPYVTSSSNTAVASTGISGTTLSIVGGQVAGSAQVLVIDAAGTQVVIAVTVGSVAPQALFTSAPNAVTLPSGGSFASFVVGGGMPSYAASSSNAAVVSASVSGTTLNISAGATGSATVLVLDSFGAKVEIAVTVGSNAEASPFRTTAPSSITFLFGAASGAYTIAGGVAPYAASSSNAAVAAASVAGNGLSITPGAVGSTTVFVMDSAGTRIELAITVGSSTAVTPLRTTAASAITLGNGGSGSFTIAGGVSPYLTSSSNTSVAVSGISGTTLSIVGGQTSGTAQILVIDATGTQLVISVTVGSVAAQPLFTTAPTAITLATSVGFSRFTVGGGMPPYAASTSNSAVASASVSGTTLNIAGGVVGSATILVLDSLGAKVEIAVTVGSAADITPLRTTAPSTLTLGTTQSASYLVSGGTAPYLTSSNNPGLVASAISGSTLTITSAMAAGTAQILVIDSTGSQVIVTVTVSTTAAQPLFTSAPSSVSMASGAAPATFTIGGGVSPYSASSSNVGNATATVSGTTLIVTSVSVGPATIALLDALGAKVEFTVTVGSSTVATPLRTDAPSALTLSTGNVRTYTVAGGQGPYAANSANEGVAKASLAGTTLTVTAIGTGTTQVLVLDASGTQVLIAVTVGGTAPTALFLAGPANVTVSTGAAPATYSIGGGTPPYSAQTSNAAVATVSVTGATLSVSGISVGSASVSIFDSTGVQVGLLVTVSANSPVALSASPSGATGNVGDVLTFTLHGGSPSYSLFSNNTSIATLSTASLGVDGGSFTATLVNVGTAIVSVRDSLGQTTSFVISVTSSTPQLRVSPSTFVVGENENSAITLNVYGGTAPYRVLTSDLVKSSATVTGSIVTTSPGTSTNRCINPVTDATPPVYIRGGTYDVTFTVIDSLGASATSVMTIRDNSAGDGVGCP